MSPVVMAVPRVRIVVVGVGRWTLGVWTMCATDIFLSLHFFGWPTFSSVHSYLFSPSGGHTALAVLQ